MNIFMLQLGTPETGALDETRGARNRESETNILAFPSESIDYPRLSNADLMLKRLKTPY
jgi:hypothetical protein